MAASGRRRGADAARQPEGCLSEREHFRGVDCQCDRPIGSAAVAVGEVGRLRAPRWRFATISVGFVLWIVMVG